MLKKGEEIAIWGSGSTAKKTYYLRCRDYKVVCFYDNNKAKWGSEIYGIPIIKFNDKARLKIIISSVHWKEISGQLMQAGLKPFTDFIPYCFLGNSFISYEELFELGCHNISELIQELKGQREIAVLYGNCQTAILANILSMEQSFSEKYLIVKIPAVCDYISKGGRHKVCWDHLLEQNEFWKQIGLFIYQKVAVTNRFSEKLATSAIVKKLSAGCRLVKIVNIYFSGYFLQAVRNQHNYMDDIHQSGLYPFGDKYIDEMSAQGLSVDEILEKIEREDFFSTDAVYKAVEQSLLELKKREEDVDVVISDYISENYDKRQLFYSFNHPINEVLVEYVWRILDFLGLRVWGGELTKQISILLHAV